MIDIEKLNIQLKKEGAKWSASETSISNISNTQFKRMLGWNGNFELPIKKPRPFWKNKLYKWAPGDKFEQEVDWRNKKGKNYVTPVKDQGGCGSCVSFAVAGLVESMALIEKDVFLDLSESDIAFCGSHPSDCSGWEQGGALSDMKRRGSVTENKFAYNSAFPGNDSWNSPPSCTLLPNHDKYSIKISDFENIYDITERKSYISNVGPLVAGITVYDEFRAFRGNGIYSPSSIATKVGGHCVLIIGYSEIEKYWLIKNSWGNEWGDNGFCRIAYGACDIDIDGTYYTNCEGVIIPEIVLGELILNKGCSPLENIQNIICCDGFFSKDDNTRHAIVGSIDGKINEIFFNPETGKGQSLLTIRDGLVDLGSFSTDDSNYRHSIMADAYGNISEIYYSPKTGIGITHLANIQNAKRVCGFYSSDDKTRHAIVATSSGEIIEIFYNQNGKGQSQLSKFSNLVDICCFYSPEDKFRHVIVATANGEITEIFFHPQKGLGQIVLANIPGIKRIGGFYSTESNYYNRRVHVLTEDHKIYEIRFSPVNGIIKNVLFDIEGVVDIGSFYSSDDAMAHCILALKNGDVKELFYST